MVEKSDVLVNEDLLESYMKRTIYHNLKVAMEAVLKLAYCTSRGKHNKWKNDVMGAMDEIQRLLVIGTNRTDVRLGIYATEHLQSTYDKAVEGYAELAMEYHNLRDNQKLIPNVCPWAITEFVYIDPEAWFKLLTDLPKPRDFDEHVYMQLFPEMCSTSMYQCRDCHNRDYCVKRFNERYAPLFKN